MPNQPKTAYERSVELQEARRQDAVAGHKQLYELAEKITGLTTAERVASVARKRSAPSCTAK
ncbi:MAG: hypothetical protein EOO61_03175 [Hymenobacter sp.]|nr:MAG: hypothetical protein EOO61_03175 [Hymenobacter sp.]